MYKVSSSWLVGKTSLLVMVVPCFFRVHRIFVFLKLPFLSLKLLLCLAGFTKSLCGYRIPWKCYIFLYIVFLRSISSQELSSFSFLRSLWDVVTPVCVTDDFIVNCFEVYSHLIVTWGRKQVYIGPACPIQAEAPFVASWQVGFPARIFSRYEKSSANTA